MNIIINTDDISLIKYDESYKKVWDDFVQSNPSSCAGHHSSMFAMERETANATNHSIMVFDNEAKILALFPLYLVERKELKIIKKRVLNSGTHLASGPLIKANLGKKTEEKILTLLVYGLENIGRRLSVDEISIAYPNIIQDCLSLNRFGYFPLKHFGYKENNIVTMIKTLEGDDESLFDTLDRQCRKMIRRCRKEGVEFKEILERDQWLDCYELNLQTMGCKAYSKKAFEIVWDQFVVPGASQVTAIIYQGKIVNVLVTVSWNNNIYFWLGFNSKTNYIPGSANLLLWETMLLFKRNGVRYLELGSMEFVLGKHKRIGQFKESFNGTPMYMLSGSLELRPFKSAIINILRVLREKFSYA